MSTIHQLFPKTNYGTIAYVSMPVSAKCWGTNLLIFSKDRKGTASLKQLTSTSSTTALAKAFPPIPGAFIPWTNQSAVFQGEIHFKGFDRSVGTMTVWQ